MEKRKEEFKVFVVTVDFHLIGDKEKSSHINIMLEDRGIPFIDWGDLSSDKYILQYLNPDVIFRQSRHETSIPKPLQTFLSGAFKICYLPYGLDIVQIPQSNVNSELLYAAWRVYVCSDLQAQYHHKESKIKIDNVRVVGSPRLDSIASKSIGKSDNDDTSDKRLKILWAPHHSMTDDWLSFGTFPEICWQVLNFAKINHDIEFIMRPHHNFQYILKNSKKMSESEINLFFIEWNGLPNTRMDYSCDYEGVFCESDLLLSDGVSFLAEYQVTSKPVIFVERKNHVDFNIFGEFIIQGVYRYNDINDALMKIIAIKNGENDSLKEKRNEIKNQLMPTEGKSVEFIIEDILQSFVTGE